MNIDFKKAFTCPTHGNSPKWIVSDGKNVGPLKRRVDHLTELDHEQSDERILTQSTKSADRVFLNSKKERLLVCQLVTGEVSMNDFVEISEMSSDNGLLIIDLVRHILEIFPDEMPQFYKKFIANISKLTSVRGLLQVLTTEPLQYLEDFCRQTLNLHLHTSQQQLKSVTSNLPALWPDLDAMCNSENSQYLPRAVSIIILKLLKIR